MHMMRHWTEARRDAPGGVGLLPPGPVFRYRLRSDAAPIRESPLTDPIQLRAVPQPDHRPSRRRLFIRDLVIACDIGVHAHEHGQPQRVAFNIDLTLRDDGPPPADDLSCVLSYEDLVVGIRALAGSGHVNLVETLAERVAALCFSDDRVLVARIRIEKLDVFHDAAGVGVEIERMRA